MKKMMALILTVTLCSMVLVSCGSSNTASSGNTPSPEVGTSCTLNQYWNRLPNCR